MMTFFELAHMVDATQQDALTFFELAHMVDATQQDALTFFELAHMVDVTQQDASLGRGFRGGVGWGGDDDIL